MAKTADDYQDFHDFACVWEKDFFLKKYPTNYVLVSDSISGNIWLGLVNPSLSALLNTTIDRESKLLWLDGTRFNETIFNIAHPNKPIKIDDSGPSAITMGAGQALVDFPVNVKFSYLCQYDCNDGEMLTILLHFFVISKLFHIYFSSHWNLP